MNTWTKNLIILLLAANAYLLMTYAPLVPKAVILMDDVHELRNRSAGWQETAEGIQGTLESLEKKFSFLRSELKAVTEKKGLAWPEPTKAPLPGQKPSLPMKTM